MTLSRHQDRQDFIQRSFSARLYLSSMGGQDLSGIAHIERMRLVLRSTDQGQ